MINVVFNMETADPDDVMTLCFLATYPGLALRGVTISPGTNEQVGLVRHVLNLLEVNGVPIGVRKRGHNKPCVSSFHYKWLGKTQDVEPDEMGYRVLEEVFHKFPDTVILSGAPLGNVASFLKDTSTWTTRIPTPPDVLATVVHCPKARVSEIVVQGGFAGDNVVAPEDRLEKFAGKIYCPTFNLGGDKEAALYITADSYKQVAKKYFVSKNVCHGLAYNQEFHEKVKQHKDSNKGLSMIYRGMEVYLKDHPNGKLFHDPLAACVLINKEVCAFKEVELVYSKGQWGSMPAENTNTYISVKLNREKFEEVFLGESNG
jgi:inosine-uridine nucleoside N-ribohydrolase